MAHYVLEIVVIVISLISIFLVVIKTWNGFSKMPYYGGGSVAYRVVAAKVVVSG